MTRRNARKPGWVFPLFSPDSDDRLSLNFHRFVIWYRSCGTQRVGLGQHCLPKGSNGFKPETLCFPMIHLVTFKGHASASTTVLRLWCKNAVGSLLNSCYFGLQTECKPRVAHTVQLITAEWSIKGMKPEVCWDLSHTAQEATHRKYFFLQDQEADRSWRMWNRWKWRFRWVIRLKVVWLSPTPFRLALVSCEWSIIAVVG